MNLNILLKECNSLLLHTLKDKRARVIGDLYIFSTHDGRNDEHLLCQYNEHMILNVNMTKKIIIDYFIPDNNTVKIVTKILQYLNLPASVYPFRSLYTNEYKLVDTKKKKTKIYAQSHNYYRHESIIFYSSSLVYHDILKLSAYVIKHTIGLLNHEDNHIYLFVTETEQKLNEKFVDNLAVCITPREYYGYHHGNKGEYSIIDTKTLYIDHSSCFVGRCQHVKQIVPLLVAKSI